MLVCIPSNGADVDHDTVCRHFGSAPYFTLFDNEKDSIEVIENTNAHHSHGQCHPMSQLDPYHIDGVVCTGLGRRAAENLQQQGITIYRAKAGVIRNTIDQARENKLVAIDPDDIGCGDMRHRMTRRPDGAGTGAGRRYGPGAGRGQSVGRGRGVGNRRGGGGRGR